jgi:hypothetical protein
VNATVAIKRENRLREIIAGTPLEGEICARIIHRDARLGKTGGALCRDNSQLFTNDGA